MVDNTKRFNGIVPAFYACYDDQGEISARRTGELARWTVAKGVQGLYLTGSSGEGMMHDVAERKKTVEAVLDAVGDRTTVIVQVGASNQRDAVDLARHAAAAGAHGVSSVPTVYYPLPEALIEAYWDAIVQAAKLPFFIYNIPATTGYQLSLSLFEKMMAKDYVAGVKTTSESCTLIEAMRRIGGPNAVIFNGVDAQLLAGLSMGASGGIGGTYGCMPELYVHIWQAFQAGNMASALRWQERANIAANHGRQPNAAGIAVMKAVLEARGMPSGGVRLPMRSVDPGIPAIQETALMIEGWLGQP